MTKQLNVYPLPALARDLPATGVSVAIDVLRATTTITTALANGARRVLPFETIEETLAAKKAILASQRGNAEELLLGGEREGLPISGFDLGNSPDSYTPETVVDKTILFTTTNGTKAILQCRGTVYVASFLNASAVVETLLANDAPDPISIVCAGTNGQYTEEDLALAGLLVDRLTRARADFELNVQAEVAREQWRANCYQSLFETLAASRGGQNLKRIELLKDVDDAAKLDSLNVVAEYRVGEIRLAGSDWKRDA
ncbi:MAG: 2-phosphosulfolactate phosphatase [Thermoguttaceae bacterium]|jgi:2-phosphosulfolactate phosphatase